jgi:hypothetical protein
MNIFVTDDNPMQAAAEHCDKHVLKMIFESAQLLSTVVRGNRAMNTNHEHLDRLGVYKATHADHPCTKWIDESTDNFMWVVVLGKALCEQYRERYDKTHKSLAAIAACERLYRDEDYRMAWALHTPFVIVAPMPFRLYAQEHGVEIAYRVYIASSKRKFARWQYSSQPWWWQWAVAESDRLFENTENLSDDGLFDNAENKGTVIQSITASDVKMTV